MLASSKFQQLRSGRSWQWWLAQKRVVFKQAHLDGSDGRADASFRLLFDGRQIKRLDVRAAAADAAAAAGVAVVVIDARVLEAENLGVVLAARLPVVDRNLSETLLDAVIDDVLHRDGRGRRRVVLVAVAPPVNPPLVFLEVGLLPELVAALAAAERPLSVFRADLVSLQGRLVREDDAAADALEGIGRRRRRPGIGLF